MAVLTLFFFILLIPGTVRTASSEMQVPYCLIELYSISYDDPGFVNTASSIRVNGVKLDHLNFYRHDSHWAYYRGLFAAFLEVDGNRCNVVNNGSYEMHKLYAAGQTFKRNIEEASNGTMIIGVAEDEGTFYMDVAHDTMVDMLGVNLTWIRNKTCEWHRASYAFVSWKGEPERARAIQVQRGLGPVRLVYDAMDDELAKRNVNMEQEVKYTVSHDRKFEGDVIQVQEVRSRLACTALCLSVPTCKTLNYYRQGAPRTCHMIGQRQGFNDTYVIPETGCDMMEITSIKNQTSSNEFV